MFLPISHPSFAAAETADVSSLLLLVLLVIPHFIHALLPNHRIPQTFSVNQRTRIPFGF